MTLLAGGLYCQGMGFMVYRSNGILFVAELGEEKEEKGE